MGVRCDRPAVDRRVRRGEGPLVLEDYAEFPADPAPTVARSAESVLASIGHELFRTVFDGPGAAGSWTLATSSARGLGELRVEVDADPADVPGLPWELLREPRTDQPVVLGAAEFVRTHKRRPPAPAALPAPDGPAAAGAAGDLPARRPRRRAVPVGGVAAGPLRRGPAWTGWSWTYCARRRSPSSPPCSGLPPMRAGRTTWCTSTATARSSTLPRWTSRATTPRTTSRPRRYGSGWPGRCARDGTATCCSRIPARARARTRSWWTARRWPACWWRPACRCWCSTPAAPPTPRPPRTPARDGQPDDDVHDRIRAYGSLAAEVADAGVAGVVAMRYNVYVVTAAQFVADLYAHAGRGPLARRGGHGGAQGAGGEPAPRDRVERRWTLQDWVVPTVYEAAPAAACCDRRSRGARRRDPDRRRRRRAPSAAAVPPAAGRGVLRPRRDAAGPGPRVRHAPRSCCCTPWPGRARRPPRRSSPAGTPPPAASTADGDPGPCAVDLLRAPPAAVAGARRGRRGVRAAAGGQRHPLGRDHRPRRSAADLVLQVLAAVPVLWIWDNVEPVAGFPAGTRQRLDRRRAATSWSSSCATSRPAPGPRCC